MSQKSSVPQAISFVSQVLKRDIAKNKPSTSDRGVAPRCEAQWDALDCSRL